MDVLPEKPDLEEDIYNIYNPTVWNDQDKAGWLEDLAESSPSDLVIVGNELGENLTKILKDSGVWDGIGIPSDIFEANTIPIEDCLIRYEGQNVIVRILARKEGGYLTIQYDHIQNFHLVIPLHFVLDETLGEKVCIDPLNVLTNDKTSLYLVVRRAQRGKGSSGIYVLFDDILKHWYSIQVLLLNPDIRTTMLKNDGKEKVSGVCCIPRKLKRRKAHYVKRHVIKTDILNSQVGDGIERHTLCWYVIGHWRNYANGKKSFIKGYWKGPLRHMERNLDEGRVRNI